MFSMPALARLNDRTQPSATQRKLNEFWKKQFAVIPIPTRAKYGRYQRTADIHELSWNRVPIAVDRIHSERWMEDPLRKIEDLMFVFG